MQENRLLLGGLCGLLAVGCAAGLMRWCWSPDQLNVWLNSTGKLAPLLFIVLGIVLMSSFVPKTVMSVTAGALFGTWLGSGLMLITAVLAAWTNYGIGRYLLGQRFLQDQQWDSLKGKHARIVRATSAVAADMGFDLHLLARLSPVPTMIISYTMGACNARLRPYLAAAAVAIVPQVLWVHGGTAAQLGQDSSASVAQWASVILAIAGGILVSVIIPRQVYRRIQSEERAGEMAA